MLDLYLNSSTGKGLGEFLTGLCLISFYGTYVRTYIQIVVLGSTMADPKGESSDLYAVLGLKKDCTSAELKNAYKKLAMKWHPDRCSASGNSKYVEEAKLKFQDIQEAYSVLSDANKRLMYDVGVHDCDDEGMCDFLNEMADMMNQNQASGNGGESFEELQKLFGEMFHRDMEAFCSTSQPVISNSNTTITSHVSCGENSNASNKRNSLEMNLGKTKTEGSSSFDTHLGGFCSGGGASGNFQEKSKRRKDSRRGR